MSDTFATELLELIIDFVACDATQERTGDLLSLSLSCKALVPCSQKHIFRNVALYPPVKDHRPKAWSAPPVYLKRYDRTTSFLRTAAQRPHLASHVRTLGCSFTAQWLDTDSTLRSNVLQAFEHMSSVEILTLAYEDPYEGDTRLECGLPSISLSGWMVGIISMLQSPHLEALTIRNLSGYPGQTILRSSHLRYLTLLDTKLQPVISSENLESSTSAIPQLQSLACDWVSLREGLTYLLSEIDMTLAPLGLVDAGHSALISQVQVLDLSPTLVTQDEVAALLSQTSCLQELILRVQCTAGYPMACPLNTLNSASLNTLSRLTLHIVVGIAGSGMDLDLPYGFEWKDVLSQMKNIERFGLHLEYEGNFDVRPSSFGFQWGDIPELLADSNQMPQLKEVDLSIHMRVMGEGEDVDEEDRANAEAFLQKVQTSVYPPWFLPLKRRQEQGDLVGFSYRTEISVNPTGFS